MRRRTKTIARLDEALLDLARDFRGTALSHETADKITMRVLDERTRARPEPLDAEEIRALREQAHMSQAVFACLLNVTPAYLSKLERGAKRPSGPALALLHIIRRKGIEAVL
jgi:putative transcriptional regulator